MASPSEDLQGALFALLTSDAGVSALIGGRVYDGPPVDYPCVTFGPTYLVPEDADDIQARAETVQIDCWMRDDARLRLTKRLSDAVFRAVHRKTANLPTHALVSLEVTLVRNFMDRDGLTGHGVIQVECQVEELG